jgi:hypothetical protein
VVLAALAAGGTLYFLDVTAPGPVITGPDEIVAGERGTWEASFAGADDFRWTDPAGATSNGPELSFNAVVPGVVDFEVEALTGGEVSNATSRRITITESPDAPRIIGDDEIPLGEPTVFRFEAPEGATNPEWRAPDGVNEAPALRVEPDRIGTYELTLIVTLEDGTRVGTRRTFQIVNN